MLGHCEMEVQSKSIKRLNSGQGLGDPSPQGDPDKPSDPPFQRMTRLQALQAPVIYLAALQHGPFVSSITVDLLLFFFFFFGENVS